MMSRTLAILVIASLPIYTLDWVRQSDHSCSCGSEETEGGAGGCHSSSDEAAPSAASGPRRGGCSLNAHSRSLPAAAHSCCGPSVRGTAANSEDHPTDTADDGEKNDSPGGCGGRCVALSSFVGVKSFIGQTPSTAIHSCQKPLLMAAAHAQRTVIQTLYRPLTRDPPQA